jgi:hypothetical protein
MLELFWDLYQQRQIGQAHQAAGDARRRPKRQGWGRREVARADERIDKLVLIAHAMWTLVAEKTGLTEADLLKPVTEVDGQDGTIDGRITRPPVRCSKCDAVISRKFNRCLFCGQAYTGGGAFETL